jgi:PAS domain S-box-containing protein
MGQWKEKGQSECNGLPETAKNELTGKEIELSHIIQGNSIPTFVINRDHVVVHYNRACENLTGLKAGDLIGTRDQWRAFYKTRRPVMADLLVDNVSEEEIRKLYGDKFRKSAVIEGGYEAEDFFQNLGGKEKWVFFTAAPIKNAQGEIVGAIETLQDITERKLAESAMRESRRRYRTFIDFVPYPIVASTLDGYVYYVNPSFTEAFGWSLAEIRGRRNPSIPPDLEQEADEKLSRIKEKGALARYFTRRSIKDGRVRDVAITSTLYPAFQNEPAGCLEIMRDITQEIQDNRRKEVILRISRALPQYPDLEELLDYVSSEIKLLIGTEGALVILHDEEKKELSILGAAYDDSERERRVKEIRFRLDELMAGEVARTGRPIIVNDAIETREKYPERDKRFGYHTENFLLVPVKSGDRIIAILSALNIKEGQFDQNHLDMLEMLAGSVALSIENARFADQIKRAYREVTSLNRAKDKVINHLSHELKTPVSVLSGSLEILSRSLLALPEDQWRPVLDRARRNLDRLVQIQEEVEDIIHGAPGRKETVSEIFGQCADLIESFLAEDLGEGPALDAFRQRIHSFVTIKTQTAQNINPADFLTWRLEALTPLFSHRNVEIITHISPAPLVHLPPEVFQKTLDGLVRNALENTPDEGRIEIMLRPEGNGTRLQIHDYGIGITEEAGRRVFEGFFSNRAIQSYSSGRPFDFHAGGKGADLLRMKIFSERYQFNIRMRSVRCRFIPHEEDICPGRISQCRFCTGPEDCRRSGETVFTLDFPPANV